MRVGIPRSATLFLYVWLMVGFSTGTALLLGPVKWITGALRSSSWSTYENVVMVGVMLLFVASSCLLSYLLVQRIRVSRSWPLRWGVPATATATSALALWGWMNPAVYATAWGGKGGEVVAGGAQFVFGPYPDAARLAELKSQGFTAVVSLQHPAVLPFEPPAIAAEETAARAAGIRFIHAPMLPWISENRASLQKVRDLVAQSGRYYVHCGLGRDRTNVVKRMLEQSGASFAQGPANERPRSFSVRLAEGKRLMERGAFREVERDIWLIPYPNQHELYGNMLAGQVGHVLVMLDPESGQQAQWMAHLQQVLAEHRVGFTQEPLRTESRAWLADLIARARALPRPLAIVVAHTPPHPWGEPAQKLVREWTGEWWTAGETWKLLPFAPAAPAAVARR